MKQTRVADYFRAVPNGTLLDRNLEKFYRLRFRSIYQMKAPHAVMGSQNHFKAGKYGLSGSLCRR